MSNWIPTFRAYQERARETAVYPKHLKVLYPSLGLAGECGEVCEKIKKVYRDESGVFTKEKIEEIEKELGDVLWYLSNIAYDLCINLDFVALKNIQKLNKRKEENKLHGSGDNR